MKGKTTDRLNKIYTNNKGEEFIIVEYNNATDVTVMFLDEYRTKIHTQFYNIKKGIVRNPYFSNIYNVGYIGVGKHIPTIKRRATHKYETWRDMIRRCHSENFHKRNSAYIGTTMCKEWYNFQIFGDWYDENYYEIKGQVMNLDKDIIVKGNKFYSPETCVFVPSCINSVFTKSDKARGECVIGVNFHSRDKVFEANCNDMFLDKPMKKPSIYLGRFDNENDAFLVYKNYKENYIKRVADFYKESIPNKLYEAMYNWVVESTD